MSLYAAIDLHSTNSVLAVIDEADQPLRQRRLPNELPAILKELEPFRDEVAGIVVESTYNWYWLVDGLKAHGYTVHLANTAAVPQYAGLKYSGDESDARHLAHLLRLGILPEGYIYPREDRAVRDLLRRRFQLVRMATGLMLSIQSTWARHTGQRVSANAIRKLSGVEIEQTFADVSVRFSVLTHLQVWHAIQGQVQQVEEWILDSRTRCKEQLALHSMPGIGRILGLTIALETGDITRFASVGDYASYCRMVKSERISNGKKKGRGNRKCGNRYLAWAWIEAANFALRFSPPIRRWYDRKCSKRHKVIAIKAVAHKLARAGYYLLRDSGRFDVYRAFG
ncbi:IS110 family transposase [Dokdonella soli]|uniref:IS110 family transposase n=1 Tax=Dokdonella soli TaxID=529810 RepID=UPI0036135C92